MKTFTDLNALFRIIQLLIGNSTSGLINLCLYYEELKEKVNNNIIIFNDAYNMLKERYKHLIDLI